MDLGRIESNMEAAALRQFRRQRDWLKGALIDYVKANPVATQAAAAAYINGLADAYASDEVGIRDRLTLLGSYVAEAGGWVAAKALILAHPKNILLKIAPEDGREVPTVGKRVFWQLVGNPRWGLFAPPDTVETVLERSSRSSLPVRIRYRSELLGLHCVVTRPVVDEGNRDRYTGEETAEVE